MRFEFYGLAFETPHVICHLWSPWRATTLEHRLFEALRLLPRAELEEGADERRLTLADPRTCRLALQAAARVPKGWAEAADTRSVSRTGGVRRRAWVARIPCGSRPIRRTHTRRRRCDLMADATKAATNDEVPGYDALDRLDTDTSDGAPRQAGGASRTDSAYEQLW